MDKAVAMDPMQPEGSIDALFGDAAEAQPRLRALIDRAAVAAGLHPDSQPNSFIEVARGAHVLERLPRAEKRTLHVHREQEGKRLGSQIDERRGSVHDACRIYQEIARAKAGAIAGD